MEILFCIKNATDIIKSKYMVLLTRDKCSQLKNGSNNLKTEWTFCTFIAITKEWLIKKITDIKVTIYICKCSDLYVDL